MSDATHTPENDVPVILCDASSPQAGSDRPYFIGYSDMVDGYRHAWTETSRSGRKTLRHGRTPNHPADPRCPECVTPSAETGGAA